MPFNLGPLEISLLVVLVLIIFGPRRLPEMARAFGEAIQEFRKAGRKVQREVTEALEEEPPETTSESTSTTKKSA